MVLGSSGTLWIYQSGAEKSRGGGAGEMASTVHPAQIVTERRESEEG
jgi:hypothetical protein